PAHYRTVFVLRMVEQLSTEDTATALDLTPDIVKIRLHRARAMMRKHLFKRAGLRSADTYAFHATRCDRVVANVFRRIAALSV
ncbi:MAG TPA: sigma factor-like helix-turn-helix DNA-binding protein, partial [Clostridia bacterium]|nr:sigma factor-like helix-turn-helix DNA-binding protein [Clostridia bacterium]